MFALVFTTLNGSSSSQEAVPGQHCLECGLCCNGVIFADVKLRSEDDAERLGILGLFLPGVSGGRKGKSKAKSPRLGPRNPRFLQPCAALDGYLCRIYEQRPAHCRQFECLLLKRAKAGRLRSRTALNIIRMARKRAEKVQRLLLALGDETKEMALSSRFRRMAKRFERSNLDKETADRYGQLTVAVHDLNLLLSEAFYPE